MSTEHESCAPIPALTLRQPRASLLATGWSRTDERTWATGYRGLVAIHAGEVIGPGEWALWDRAALRASFRARARVRNLEDAPRGCVIAVAELAACKPVESVFSPENDGLYLHPNDVSLNPLRFGSLLLCFRKPRLLLSNVYVEGRANLWQLPGWAEARVREQLGMGRVGEPLQHL